MKIEPYQYKYYNERDYLPCGVEHADATSTLCADAAAGIVTWLPGFQQSRATNMDTVEELKEGRAQLVAKKKMQLLLHGDTFRYDDTKQQDVMCKTCKDKVTTSRSNTTNLYQHLKHHKEKYEECIQRKAQQRNVKDTTEKRLKRPQQRTIKDTFANVPRKSQYSQQ